MLVQHLLQMRDMDHPLGEDEDALIGARIQQAPEEVEQALQLRRQGLPSADNAFASYSNGLLRIRAQLRRRQRRRGRGHGVRGRRVRAWGGRTASRHVGVPGVLRNQARGGAEDDDVQARDADAAQGARERRLVADLAVKASATEHMEAIGHDGEGGRLVATLKADGAVRFVLLQEGPHLPREAKGAGTPFALRSESVQVPVKLVIHYIVGDEG
mmetsp:Transcript_85879/g.262791  ORF Transcript_85879/g.262791 Transcript_85879/m.262791 type:complete len:214 (+) Transcript_85879:407-1048(+)